MIDYINANTIIEILIGLVTMINILLSYYAIVYEQETFAGIVTGLANMIILAIYIIA